MTAAWPAGVPSSFHVAGFVWRVGEASIRSEVDAGVPTVRLRTTAVPDTISGTMPMRWDEYLALRDWYRVVLRGGALPFTLPHPFGTGDDLVCRWRSPPAANAVLGERRVVVSVELEVLP